MSVHIEWTGADRVMVEVHEPGWDADGTEEPTKGCCLAIGDGSTAYVIEGSPAELVELVERIVAISDKLPRRGPHMTARFVPQAWVNDNAIDVDPQGPTEWDVTEAVRGLPESYRAGLERDIHEWGEALDGDDLLKSDPAAPEWVREWQGPFSLYVRQTH